MQYPDPNCGYVWTDKEWAEWRRCNGEVLAMGGRIWTNMKMDGSVEEWYQIGDETGRRDPQWVERS